MPLYRVRNRKSRVTLGEVHAEDESDALGRIAEQSGCTVEEIAGALGKTAEEAKANLEITAVDLSPTMKGRSLVRRKTLDHLPRRYG